MIELSPPRSQPAAPDRPFPFRRFAFPLFRKGALQALNNPNYRRYWLGQSISILGSWMQITVASWAALHVGRTPFNVGLVMTLEFLPMLLLTLFSGALLDTLPKRRLLLGVQSVALVHALLFSFLMGFDVLNLPILCFLALIGGILNALDFPGRQAFSAELVEPEQIKHVVALNTLAFNVARMLGPALAGLLLPLVGPAVILGLNGLSYSAILIGLLRIDEKTLHYRPTQNTMPLRQRLLEGFSFAFRTPEVASVLLMSAIIGLFCFTFPVIVPLVAGFVLATNATGLALIWSALGVGSLTAAIVAAIRAPAITRQSLLTTAILFATLLGLLAFSPWFMLSLLLFGLMGYTAIGSTISISVLLHRATPPQLKGRILSLNMTLLSGTTALSGLILGIGSSWLGVNITLLICALCCVLGLLGAMRYALPSPPASETRVSVA